MRRLLLILMVFFTTTGLQAQKVGYVDTDFILEKIPEYQEAVQRLNEMSQEWQKQVDRKYEDISKMYKDLEAEEILLTDDMRRKRQAEIARKEQEALEFQKKKFGVDGELFKERQKLIKPIQDKVFEAVKEVARAGGFVIMMDKAGSTTLIYTNSKYNKSKAVLKKLGYDIDDDDD
jgi:outer membrane protein